MLSKCFLKVGMNGWRGLVICKAIAHNLYWESASGLVVSIHPPGLTSTLLCFAQCPLVLTPSEGYIPQALLALWPLVGLGRWEAPVGDRRMEENEVGAFLPLPPCFIASVLGCGLQLQPGRPSSPAISNRISFLVPADEILTSCCC